jgi:CubicO group peptidase (beta-lactamase class C family)
MPQKFLPTAAFLAAFALFAPAALRAQTLDLTPVPPESVGFNPERLERLYTFLQGEVDQKQIAGAVTILARHGKVVEYRTYGQRDIATSAPMTKDTIFRDYSMTKPTTGVAMMILYEQGKWLPSDPISKFIPEFAHLKVFNGFDANGRMLLADPVHPPTMRELMTHTAGFTYGQADTPVDQLYKQLDASHAAPRKDPAPLSTRDALGLQHVHGHPGLHSREAHRPIAPRL